LVAIGLDSSEVGHPPEKFKNVFASARSLGLATVAHAGEEGPTDYIWQALDILKVSRIDHGVRSIEDESLIKHLAETQTPLTTCPLSNLSLKVYDNLAKHPLKALLDKGLCVTINSDDPSFFNGYLEENFIATQLALQLDKDDLKQLAKNSFQAAFISDVEKKEYIAEIDKLPPL